MVSELTHFVSVEVFGLETAASKFEAVKVCRVILFEGTDKSLHVELGAGLVLTEVGEADFDFVAEFGGFFFGLGDTSFVTLGEFDFGGVASTAGGWTEKGAKSFNEPNPIWIDVGEWFAAGFDFFNPFVGGLFVPIIGNRTGEDLNPELFGSVGAEFGESTGDTSKWVDLEVIKGFNREGFVFDEVELSGVNNWVFFAVVDVIVIHFVDLNGRILGVDLAFDETLEDFWHPDIKTDLATSRNNFKTEVFLDATGVFELHLVT